MVSFANGSWELVQQNPGSLFIIYGGSSYEYIPIPSLPTFNSQPNLSKDQTLHLLTSNVWGEIKNDILEETIEADNGKASNIVLFLNEPVEAGTLELFNYNVLFKSDYSNVVGFDSVTEQIVGWKLFEINGHAIISFFDSERLFYHTLLQVKDDLTIQLIGKDIQEFRVKN